MLPISRPKTTVRIIANTMSSVPATAVATAIGLSMEPPLERRGSCYPPDRKSSERGVGPHQLREEAFVRRSEIRETDLLRSAAVNQVERQIGAAGRPDWHREQLGGIGDLADAIWIVGRDDISPLILAKKDRTHIGDLRDDCHAHADVPGKGHFGDCDGRAAVGAV